MPDPKEQSISQRQNSEQKRGRQAWENIQQIKQLNGSTHKKLEKKSFACARLKCHDSGQRTGSDTWDFSGLKARMMRRNPITNSSCT